MNVLFVYFDFMIGAGGKYYEGLASISAVLKQRGHKTRLMHITRRIDCAEFLRKYELEYADAGVVAFSATSHVFPYVAEFAGELKQRHPQLRTICGGAHPTLFPERAVLEDGLDAICVGEGEYPMAEYCDALAAGADPTGIRNLWFNQDGEIIRNPVRPLIENLDELPTPDRELFDYGSSMDKRMNRVAFMGSRGCPYDCTHCCNHALKAAAKNPAKYVRFKSVERLIGEIEACLRANPVAEHVDFHDDILNLKPRWFEEFVAQYKRRIGRPYICCSRFELLKDASLALFKESGCRQLSVGLESGDEYVRTEVLNRRQSESMILQAGALCRQYGINLYVFTMVGIPGETLVRALRTVKLAAALKPASIQVSIFYPYVSTRLHELCKQNGWLAAKRVDSYFEAASTLNFPDFPPRQIVFAYEHLRPFAQAYMFIAAWKTTPLGRVIGPFAERGMDFLWRCPALYSLIEKGWLALRRQYRRHLKWRFQKRPATRSLPLAEVGNVMLDASCLAQHGSRRSETEHSDHERPVGV